MKFRSLAILSLVSIMMSSDVFAKESPCSTDGCVMTKNALFSSVMSWLNESDDCITTVSWIQAIKKVSDTDFQVQCGDTNSSSVITLRAEQTSTDTFSVVRVK